MKKQALVVFLFMLWALWGTNCMRNKNPISPKDENGNNEPIEFVTCPQTDIPWPSLADSPWPMFLHDPQHTSRSPYQGPTQGEFLILAKARYEVMSSPAITENGSIVVGSDGLYAFSPSGSEVWHFETGGQPDQIQSSPLITSTGTIYVGCQNGILYSLRSDGSLKWTFDTGMVFGLASPCISKDGKVIYANVFSGQRRTFFSVDSTGSLLWKYELMARGSGVSSPAISPDGKTIYVTDGEFLHAVSDDGNPKWQFGALGGLVAPESWAPVIDNDGNVYFNSTDFCYSVSPSGSLRWKSLVPVNSLTAPCIGYDGTIYTYGLGGGYEGLHLYALDYAGNLKWRTAIPGSPSPWGCSSPSVDIEGTVYLGLIPNPFGEPKINFIAMDREGRIKYTLQMQTPGGLFPDIDTSPVIGEGGVVYTGSDAAEGWYVFAIR